MNCSWKYSKKDWEDTQIEEHVVCPFSMNLSSSQLQKFVLLNDSLFAIWPITVSIKDYFKSKLDFPKEKTSKWGELARIIVHKCSQMESLAGWAKMTNTSN